MPVTGVRKRKRYTTHQSMGRWGFTAPCPREGLQRTELVLSGLCGSERRHVLL